MKIPLLLVACAVTTVTALAQKITYDLVTFQPPTRWQKQTGNSNVTYSHADNRTKAWCQITVYKNTVSQGTIDNDFNIEWQTLVAKDHTITAGPQKSEVTEVNGWQYLTGGGKARFNGQDMMIFHTVIRGHNACVSIVAKTNHANYLPAIEQFNASLEMQQPGAVAPQQQTTSNDSFASTTWDDGWVTTEHENWAAVSKATTRVLIHHPNKQCDAYNAVLKDGLHNAWNILIVPRYSNIRNYQLKPIQSFESIAFAEADATEPSTGNTVHLVLFKKHYATGNGRYLEFITPDKASFERAFGPYHNDEFGWDNVSAMQYRNKFAVDAASLHGTWAASDYASLSYYYTQGGGYAGATATSIAHEFTFLQGGKYQSDHAGASGVVGNQKFSRQVYKGDYTVDRWEMKLTNRFQGAAEPYQCYFEAIYGGRILVMTDAQKTVYTLVRRP
jgi:hypothetical protein